MDIDILLISKLNTMSQMHIEMCVRLEAQLDDYDAYKKIIMTSSSYLSVDHVTLNKFFPFFSLKHLKLKNVHSIFFKIKSKFY